MRVRVLITCLALCLAAGVLAAPAGAAIPVKPTVQTGPPPNAIQSGESFAVTGVSSHTGATGVQTNAALAGGAGCLFYAGTPEPIGSVIFSHAQFSCHNIYAPILRAAGCIYGLQPNNGVWTLFGCNSVGPKAGADLLLPMSAALYACRYYQAWGSFYGISPFNGQFGGPWATPSRWICP